MTAGFMGLVGLGAIDPIPGTAAHPGSWDFPTRSLPVEHRDLMRLALRADDDLYPFVRETARHLVDSGATSILTTCGYFTPYQERLAQELPVQVMTSSLMLLPWLEATSSGTVLIVAADAAALDERCLSAAGITDRSRYAVVGMEGPGPFRDQVLERGILDDPAAIVDQVVDTVAHAMEERPDVGAICLECGDMTVATPALRERFGVTVVDYMTGGRLLNEASATLA